MNAIANRDAAVLVTGASGFIGVKVVEALLCGGFRNLKCLVRSPANAVRLKALQDQFATTARISLLEGDLTHRTDCSIAAEGVSLVYHLAAGFDKSFAGAFMNSVVATRNLVDACLDRGGVDRFVLVSSFAVYSNLTMKRGALLDETAPLEDAPQERFDAYAFGKLKQEQLIRDFGRQRGLKYVILRPGTVFGPGKTELTGRIGVGTFGIFLHVGGANQLPLTYVDNCAEAIALAGFVPGIEGETFNVVDDDPLTSAQFLRAYRRRVRSFRSVRVPYPLASWLCRAWELYSIRSQGQLPPAFNRRRCAAEWKGNRFTNRKLRDMVGWSPRVPMEEAMRLFLNQFPSS